MPGRDRTGPRGEGAMSGRGMGKCAGENAYGLFGTGLGFGRRRRFGYGRAFGYGLMREERYREEQSGLENEIGFLKERIGCLEGLLRKKDKEKE